MQAKQKGDPATPRKTPETSPTYRLPSPVKAMLTRITDPHMRGHMKRMMIDAEVTAAKHLAESAKKKDKKSQQNSD